MHTAEMSAAIVRIFKQYIQEDDLESIQQYVRELHEGSVRDPESPRPENEDNEEEDEDEEENETHGPIDWGYLYQKVYLHACLKKRARIAEWLQAQFTNLDEITQIALRQIFPYGRYLLRR